MATVKQVTLSCDVCGLAKEVQTQRFGLDGKAYEIDLCPKDGKGLSKLAAQYVSKARKRTARQSGPGKGHRARSRSAAKATGAKATRGRRKKRIFVYGILPADIEMAAEMPGVGESPGLLRVVRSSGLAALVSEVDPAGRLGSPEDQRTHREILDATASELPIVPLRFGVVLASEEAVAEELLAAHHNEFTEALQELEGRTEFLVMGRYVEKPAAAEREKDTRALQEVMEGVCAARVARRSAQEDAVSVALLVPADRESEMERVIERLAQEWEGRVEVQLLGPTAAYDFVPNANLGS